MATASAAQACTPSRVRRSVEAKPQAPPAITRMPMPSDSAFGERADFAILRGDVAMANVHHAHVGVGCAAALGRLDRPVGHSLASCPTRLVAGPVARSKLASAGRGRGPLSSFDTSRNMFAPRSAVPFVWSQSRGGLEPDGIKIFAASNLDGYARMNANSRSSNVVDRAGTAISPVN